MLRRSLKENMARAGKKMLIPRARMSPVWIRAWLAQTKGQPAMADVMPYSISGYFDVYEVVNVKWNSFLHWLCRDVIVMTAAEIQCKFYNDL